jgi:MOSC domain-containing protein YiiM
MGSVVHLQYGPERGGPMVASDALRLLGGLGIENDHHARAGSRRQVLLMAEENCECFGLAPGEVRENIVTRGLDLQALPPGTRLRIGSALLEITQDCEPCRFIDTLRPGLRARIVRRRGMLARVLDSGEIRTGDPIRIEGEKPAGGPGVESSAPPDGGTT